MRPRVSCSHNISGKVDSGNVTVGNTIFGALSRQRPVDWGLVMRDVVQRVYSRMGKSKATSICPYIFHLYFAKECLLLSKKKAYRIVEAFLKHHVKPEEEEEGELEASDNSECKSLTSKEIRDLEA